jgi:hypothetical protein
MLKILGVIAVVLVIAVAAILVYAATRPDSFRVSRSATIKAPAGRIFPLIASMRRMNEWNPFAKQDPAMEIAYSGPESGVGAAQAFAGGRGGTGRLEVTAVTEPTLVTMSLDMAKPIAAHNDVTFALQPDGDDTAVTWTMSGAMPFVSKVMSVFVNMDRMIGGTFEQGLADLKALAEE